MALSLSFTGFVQEVKAFNWGNIVSVAHSNRQQNPQGEWETTSKDYIDLVIDADSEFAWLLTAGESTRISVTGNTKLSTFSKRDGSTGIGIKVWPKSIENLSGQTTIPSQPAFKAVDLADAPF